MRRLGGTSAIIALAVLVGACGSPQPHPVSKMAPFDLNCKDVSYTIIDDNTIGAIGCGKRTKYIRICNGNQWDLTGDSCRWIQN